MHSEGEHAHTSGLQRGTPEYRRAVIALLAAGLATFSSLYTTQAILPTLSDQLGASAPTAALTVSAATGALALCIVPASILSEKYGRNRIIILSALAATLTGLVVPLAPGIHALVALRGVQGALLAGVPAVAMTWLSEEIHPAHAPRAMGLYIAGTSIGGLLGRLVPSLAAEFLPWRLALLAGAATGCVCTFLVWRLLPKQKRFHPKALSFSGEARAMLSHWTYGPVAAIFALGFLLMGSFVSVYNYLGYELSHHFGLSEALVGSVFVLYLSGTVSSARAGAMSARFGAGKVMVLSTSLMLGGLLLTLLDNLAAVIVGLLVFTASFFAAHSTASGWLGVLATKDRAEASSMYLLCYYTGSAVVGWVAGGVFGAGNWAVLVGALSLLVAAAIAASVWLWLKAPSRA